MANISITIPDESLTRIVEALCDGVSPTNAKAKAKMIELVKLYVKNYENNKITLQNQAIISGAISTKNTAIIAADSEVDGINIT